MRRLFTRELVRLAPVAAACGFLGLLIYLGLAYLAPGSWAQYANDNAYLVVLFGAPWLLGSAAIAPDAESGALTFLATLPVKTWRHLLARVGAAGLYAVAVPALAALLLDPDSLGHSMRGFNLPLAPEALFPFAFAGALLTSAMIRNALGAFMLAPVIAGVPFLATVELSEYWRFSAATDWLFLAIPPALALGTWVAFAYGEHFGRVWSPRTLRLGLSVALAPCVVLVGLSSAVCAYDWSSDWHVTGAWREAGLQREFLELAQLRRLSREYTGQQADRWRYVGDDGALRSLPAGCGPGPVSPDGRWLIGLQGQVWARGEVRAQLVDLSGEAPSRAGTWSCGRTYPEYVPGIARLAVGVEATQASRHALPACWWDQPYFAVAEGLRGFDGELVAWPAALASGEPQTLAVAGGAVLVRTQLGEGVQDWVWTQDDLRRLPAPAERDAAGRLWRFVPERELSPSGRWAVAWSQRADLPVEPLARGESPPQHPTRIQVCDLARAEAEWQTVWVERRDEEDHWGSLVIQFSPNEELAVVYDPTRLGLVRLADGEQLRDFDSGTMRPEWTPSGQLVTADEVLTFVDGEVQAQPWTEQVRAAFDRYAEEFGHPFRADDGAAGPRLLFGSRGWEVHALDLASGEAQAIDLRLD